MFKPYSPKVLNCFGFQYLPQPMFAEPLPWHNTEVKKFLPPLDSKLNPNDSMFKEIQGKNLSRVQMTMKTNKKQYSSNKNTQFLPEFNVVRISVEGKDEPTTKIPVTLNDKRFYLKPTMKPF